MKRIISLVALMTFVFAVGTASAETLLVPNGQKITGTKTGLAAAEMGKLSNNVSLYVVFSTTAFASDTKHLSGNRWFGASFDDTKIYYTTTSNPKDAIGKTVNEGITTITASDSSNWSSWVSL